MTAPRDVIWSLEPHTLAKHQIIRKYLGGWYPKLTMGTWGRRRVLFLDGFAGPGLYKDGSPGSPIIALRELLEHPSRDRILGNTEVIFMFNEHGRRRFDILEEELEELRQSFSEGAGWPAGIRVITSRMRFDKLLDEIHDGLNGKDMAPMFAFVDPFGYADLSMEKLKRLLGHNACELFVYFDFNSVQRFAQAGNVDSALERLYGCDAFKEAPETGDPGRAAYLLGLYESQLRDVAGFEYVQAFQMVNKRGKTNNYMIFCSRHLDGLDLMKRAMWSVDPTGEYTFEDRLAGQDILVGFDHVEPLKDVLHRQFAGQTVTLAEVDRFVLTQTPYHRGHIKQKTLGPMRKAGRLSTPGVVGRAFPDGCSIRFEPL